MSIRKLCLGLVIAFFLFSFVNISFAIPNPAAVYCESQGHIYKIKTDKQGNEYGVCILKNGEEVNAWNLYRKNHNKFHLSIKNSIKKIKKKLPKSFLLKRDFHEGLNSLKTKPLFGIPPSSFDWRNKDGKNWVSPVRDQGYCGSCWAFSATGVAESKIKINLNNSTFDPDLSEQDLISCSNAGDCSGGYERDALAYISTTGVVNESCFPYNDSCTSGVCNNCSEKCSSSTITKINYGGPIPKNLDSIKEYIVNYGPITAYMDVYEDFITYSGGIYYHTTLNYVGLHAVSIIGYNNTGGYWICKNSWGTGWGENGYFRIAYNETSFTWDPDYYMGVIFLDDSYYVTSTDYDGDGIYDGSDNCPFIQNPTQSDIDSDGIGDACDSDIDGDGIANENDACDTTWGISYYNGCPDTYSPNLTINFPYPNYITNSKTIQINLSVTDPSYNYTNISIYKGTTLINSTTTTKNETFLVNLSVGEVGIYTIKVVSYDNFGNSNTITINNITIDFEKPQVSINNPKNGSYLNTTRVSVEVTAIDFSLNYTNISVYNSVGSLVDSIISSKNGTFTVNFTNLSDGTYIINVTSFDLAGNSRTISSTMTIDTISPSIFYESGTTYSGNYSQDWIYIKVNASDEHLDKVSLLWNGTAENFTNQNGSLYWENKTNLTDGIYIIQAQAIDLAGNTNSTNLITINLDTIPPSTNIIAVNSNGNNYVFNTWENSSINISLIPFDSNVGVNTTLYCIDKNNTCLPNLTYNNFPIQITLTGINYIRYKSIDKVGNEESVKNKTIKIDLIKPSIEIINSSFNTSDDTPSITFNYIDDLSPTGNCTLYFGNSSVASNNSVLNATNTVLTAKNQTDGIYNISIKCSDLAGNYNYSKKITIIIDTTPPEISIIYPQNNSVFNTSEIVFNWTIIDSGVGVDKVWYVKDEESEKHILQEGPVNSTTINFTAGYHSIIFKANDTLNNIKSSNTINFIVNIPINATRFIENLKNEMGNIVKTIILSNGTDQSNNSNLSINQSLSLTIYINFSGYNLSVTIPKFNGLYATWDKYFGLDTNTSSKIAGNIRNSSRTNVTKLFVFINTSKFLPEERYSNGSIITVDYNLTDEDILYIEDDKGEKVYKLSYCNHIPQKINISSMCYQNTSKNITMYIPHLSGIAIANDTLPPFVNITSPSNNITINNSYFNFEFTVKEANPKERFCGVTLANSTNNSIKYKYKIINKTDINWTGTEGIYLGTLQGIKNGAYKLKINCTDQRNQSFETYHNLTINDTIPPTIVSISPKNGKNFNSGTTLVVLSVNTSELSTCKYDIEPINYQNMKFNFSNELSKFHSATINVNSGHTYTYYIKCQDINNNTCNESSITFSVASSTSNPSNTNNNGAGGGSGWGGGSMSTPTKSLQNVSRRLKLVPGRSLINNTKLQATIEKVLAKGKLSEQAKQNMLRLSENIATHSIFTREFKVQDGKSRLEGKLTYEGNETIINFMIYDKIPKDFARKASEITVITSANVEIVEADPEYLLIYNKVSPGDELNWVYETLGERDASLINETKTELYAESFENIVREVSINKTEKETSSKKENQTGQNIEEKNTKEENNLVKIILIIVALIIGGSAYYLKLYKKKL